MKKILLTGATGYIGKRLLIALLENDYFVVCCTRDKIRFEMPTGELAKNIEVIEVDFLEEETLTAIPNDIDGAYYLMHSMSKSGNYQEREITCAENFKKYVSKTNVDHVIYLTGIVNTDELSHHLESRLQVEKVLSDGDYNFTALRAAIIIGSGSASFEIIRDLVEKLPAMIAPRWVETKCQPIGVANVLDFLVATLFNEKTYNANFDIAGPDVLSYKEMLLQYAEVRGLKRHIYTVPVMTPKLSSYWLYFVTSTNYNLAISLVDSMKVPVVARNSKINQITGVKPFPYKKALQRTLSKIEADEIISGWRDSFVSSRKDDNLAQFMEVPRHGCFVDKRKREYDDREKCIQRVWQLGGDNGWYADGLWKIRGYMDQMVGGVGLKRGRTHKNFLHAGDAIDFWRVLYADKEKGRLLLLAEMKLPGDAWLEFRIEENMLVQKAIFRPKGIWGRLYWYSVFPFHGIVFSGMLKRLAVGK
ncbi:SDR family oxidoreductase [Galbibacter mesophilus]|uniref:SDR family oxidoreductase n=1 Tax=Galbibacter mesophilus TaxID=379069 RepID=UPI00191F6559|nr:SDR family oxidoreductase [Galbibacter mesophilus]MCM5662081.1 SDR family oxidoreductase [Galbibacter mesophilus]